MKKTVVIDFDGCIHSYTSGWKGLTEIPDPPVPGIKEGIKSLRERYRVVVVSSRTSNLMGRTAVEEYLNKHGIVVDDICCEKPPAIAYIDDRAICFDGDASTLLSKVNNFKSWLDKVPEEEKEINTEMSEIKVGDIYRYYLGGIYRVVFFGYDAKDDKTPMIAYEEMLGKHRHYITDMKDFMSKVYADGKWVPKFKKFSTRKAKRLINK